MEWYEMLEVIRNTTERQELVALTREIQIYKEESYSLFSMMADCLIEQFRKCGYRYSKSFCLSVVYGLGD